MMLSRRGFFGAACVAPIAATIGMPAMASRPASENNLSEAMRQCVLLQKREDDLLAEFDRVCESGNRFAPESGPWIAAKMKLQEIIDAMNEAQAHKIMILRRANDTRAETVRKALSGVK